MGAYLGKPVTNKVSESGEFTVGSRKVLYGATAMQGWRIGMEVRQLNSFQPNLLHLVVNEMF